MINSISSGGMQMPPPMNSQSLSQEQRQTIEDTLKKFDAENLSEDDALSIAEAFKNAGIQPGKELAEVMSSLGFDAKEVGELAGITPPPPPPQTGEQESSPMTLNISNEMLQQLNDLLESYYNEDQSENDKEELLATIKEIFQETMPEGGLVNITA